MRVHALMCAVACLLLSSCGGDSACTTVAIEIAPSAATADHNAAAPGNAVQFIAHPVFAGSCGITAVRLFPNWSLSDDVNVSISSAQDSTNGTATCTNATAGQVTVTATLPKSPTQSKTMIATSKLKCD